MADSDYASDTAVASDDEYTLSDSEQLENEMLLDNEFDEKQDAVSTDEIMVDADEAKPRADDFEAIKKKYLPAIPDLEIEAEDMSTWDITNWKNLPKRTQGPIFKVGKDPFRVLFFPYGNNVDYASFYLEHGFEEEKPPEDWYACVDFALVLWNPNDPTIYIQHQAHHRFTPDEGDWGFTRFAELRKIFNNNYEEKGRPMIENDSAKMTAFVRVYKDPTGVLWHNFVNYDSKKETGMVGLKNQGATCYLNSLIQSLYFTTAFRKAIYQIPTESEQDPHASSAYALQRLFYHLQTSNFAVGTQELTRAFGWDNRQVFEQQDVQELSRVLMEKMEDKMKGTAAENALPKMFVGKMKTYLECINVEYVSQRIEDFWDIQLNVSGMKDLDASFRDYVQVETLEGDNKYFAEGFGLQDARKGVIFESFPDVLHLQLKRFEYDFQRDAMLKINDRHEFPEEFDAEPYLSKTADRSESWKYRLHSVLVHSGDLNAGHYYAFIKPEKDGPFYKYDDDRVTRATLKEAMEENFGGEFTNGPQQQRNPYTRQLSNKRSMNAYMLVYLRESRIDNLLLSEDQVVPPPHLEKRISEERAIMEKKRKDREEAHLYMDVIVATNQQFKAWEGFDIVPWTREKQTEQPDAAPKLYRILRTTTIGDFTKTIAEDLNMDPALLRPWIMVNRQNQTTRPDAPLLDPNQTVEEASIKHQSKRQGLLVWMETTDQKDSEGRGDFGENHVELRGSNGTQQDKAILLFLKYFDIETQSLRGVGQFYASLSDKVQDMSPQILKALGWPAGASYRAYEEIRAQMIEDMKPKQTLQQSELQDGDIVTVQKVLSEKEIAALPVKSPILTAKEFYDHIQTRFTLAFHPKPGSPEEHGVFNLEVNRKMTYDQLSAKVAEHLGVESTHLRFWFVNVSTAKPKGPMRRNPTTNLASLIGLNGSTYMNGSSIHNQRTDCLYYEILEYSLAEMETRKNIKVTWIHDGIQKEELYEILVPKNATMQDVVAGLQRKANLDEQTASRIRMYEAHNNKIHKILKQDAAVVNLSDYCTLYAERKPDEEDEYEDSEDVLPIPSFHFDKEPSKTHLVPFVFFAKKDEIFKDTKERLSKRTGIKGKGFEKIKFALVSRPMYSKPIYLTDEDVLFDKFQAEGAEMLGLDHVARNRNNWNRNESIMIR